MRRGGVMPLPGVGGGDPMMIPSSGSVGSVPGSGSGLSVAPVAAPAPQPAVDYCLGARFCDGVPGSARPICESVANGLCAVVGMAALVLLLALGIAAVVL